jgi:hypothetical protein
MFMLRLKAIGSALAQLARNVGNVIWTGVEFIAAKLLALCRRVWETFVWALRGVFIPKVASPFEVLKHYLAVLSMALGVMALFWAGRQVVSPPLVITVMDLPASLKSESWINPELPRTLINEIERMRSIVKGDRDPAFEAVLNPPNIVIKTGEWSLNVQEQILTPLGSLLGFGQGEVRLALTCFQPNCARTRDADCTDIILEPKTVKASERPYLCLRLTADIQRGRAQRRLTSRLILNNDTYQLEMTKQMTRIAEAVTSVADPATAALYFYRRVYEEGAATRSVTSDPEVIAELRGEAFRAAEQAESDAVSECWAHAVRAHLALIRREFRLADAYIERARNIPWYRHLVKGKFPIECQRLVAIAEMEFARRLARPARLAINTPFAEETDSPPNPDDDDSETSAVSESALRSAYPEYTADADDKRLKAADALITETGRRYAGNATVATFLGKSFDDDLVDALGLAKSEIGLGWFTPTDQCRLLRGEAVPVELEPDLATGRARAPAAQDARVDEDFVRLRTATWQVIQGSVEMIREPSTDPYLPLKRQAAIDFLEQLASNVDCIEEIQKIAERFFLNHPHDAKVAQLFGLVTEEAAMRVTRSLTRPATWKDRGNKMLQRARAIYARMVDIGDDKSDVFALARLAFITEAFLADGGDKSLRKFGPNPDTLTTITRAWRRYQQQLYPTAARHHAEQIVTFWGSLLLRFYPKLVHLDLSGEVTRPGDAGIDEMRSAIEQFTEFHRAWQVLFPSTPIRNLGDLARLDHIGPRIACLCMLSHAIYENEVADFLIVNVNKWQQRRSIALDGCKQDMVPHFNVPPPVLWNNVAAIQRLSKAKSDFDAAQDPKPPELLRKLKDAERRDANSRQNWMRHAARSVHADRRLAEQRRNRIKAAIDAAGDKVPVDLRANFVMANAAHEKAAEAISRAEEDAEEARQSIPKKVETLEKAQAACLPAPARELQPGPSAAAASPSPAP